MEKVLNMTYASSLTNLCELNSSFDAGVLRIAYHGENRNKSAISKETFEKCIKTMYNCPIVCNYDRETDTLGSHDMEVVRTDEGDLRIVNLTTPIGCIPESAKYWWDTVEEDNGEVHEYLFAEALLWKRQEAYKKIKNDGITAHSMEISVKDGELVDGVFHISNFEFTAFALIGVEPCFESSALEVFSKQDFKRQLSEMMQDLKESIGATDASAAFAAEQSSTLTEGGRTILDEKIEVIEAEEVVEETFAAEEQPSVEDVADAETYASSAENCEDATEEAVEGGQEGFALLSNVIEEVQRALRVETIKDEFGEWSRYCYMDCDLDENMVYVLDCSDWLLYGFSFSMNGDNVAIDFASKKRMKYEIAEFDEGEQASPFVAMYDAAKAAYGSAVESANTVAQEYEQMKAEFEAMTAELTELRAFKAQVEADALNAQYSAIVEKFADLSGDEAFEKLCESMHEYSFVDFEDKCFAIRGRKQVCNFSLENKPVRIMVSSTKSDESNEPYGGIFAKYGNKNN